MNPNEQNNNQTNQLANVAPAAPAPQSANQPPLMNPKKSNKIVVWLVVSLLLVMAIVAGVFFMIKDNDNSKTTNNDNSTVQNKNSKDESNSSNSNSYEALAAKSRNIERITDIKALYFSLEEYSVGDGLGYYPSLSQMNDSNWLSKNMPGLATSSLRDPSNNTSSKLSGTIPAEVGEYSYIAEPSSCIGATGSTPCTGYKVSAYLENGEGIYSKEDLQ